MKSPEGVWVPWTQSEGEITEYCRIPGAILWRTIVWNGKGWFQSDPAVSLVIQPEYR